MKLVMTLLARDEQDIIRENIEFHLAQGVDFIIATDNRSVDSTPKILKEFESRGVLHYLYEGDDDFNQHAWVTKMARMAYSEFGADWVINNDADEFWWPVEGNLKEVFERLPRDVEFLTADRLNFVVVEDPGKPFWSRMVYQEKVSLNPLEKPLPPKIAHRGSDVVKVRQGNHSVEGMAEGKVLDGLIEILHFPIRGYQQIENKIAKGGAAYERNTELPESVGVTWRELYKEYEKENNLDEYYQDNLHSTAMLNNRLAAGELVLDNRLFKFFQREPQQTVQILSKVSLNSA